jgi:small GTP-binding protein
METVLKITLIGDSAVGKSCSIISYCKNSFSEEVVPVIYENYEPKVNYDSKDFILGLCDTNGKDEYDSIRPLSYPDTDVFIINFDVMNCDSMFHIKSKWIPELKFHCPNVPYIIVGNKIDRREDEEELKKSDNYISYEEGKKFAEENYSVDYCECSAKTQEGLKNVFDSVIKIYIEKKVKKKKNISLFSTISKIFNKE